MEALSMGRRRRARELALEALYRVEIAEDPPEQVLEDIFTRRVHDEETRNFTTRVVMETWKHLREIDERISYTVENWNISRIAVIDKNVLRAAICELLYFPDVPEKVVIDEAIELAKKYSTADSGRFVNGILDRIAKTTSYREARPLSTS
jgi:transcription antitermination factor NusB